MLTDITTFIALIIAEIICIILMLIIKNNIKKSQLKNAFLFSTVMMTIMCTGVILQVVLSQKLNIEPIYFEYITYIGNAFLPVSFLLVSLIFTKTKIKLKNIYIWFVIPIISLIVLWTNDYHHMFYVKYSIYSDNIEYGKYVSVYTLYTYGLFIISIIKLLRYTVKNSSFFSKQSILISLGALVPVIVNILGAMNIISMTIYMTPISFTFTILCFAIAILKLKLLKSTPIALQRIVDRMSDSYLVITDDFSISDFNKTFVETFGIKDFKNIRGKNFQEFLKQQDLYLNLKKIESEIVKIQKTEKISSFELYVNKINKYFNIELTTIISNGESLGILILFKDITQHKEDMETIKSNQDILMERERLASLGQLIGGIAHNLKTPIMSISGAAEGLNDLITEYDTSIEDPEVNFQDHHDIANDMREWIKKIRAHTEYMSDIITAVKGQAVAMSAQEAIDFTVEELVKRVNILMKHELKNSITYLNVEMKVDPNLTLKGEINSLIQVINNMISNAIQAYGGKPEQNIDMTLTKQQDDLVISIKDYAGGLPEKVKEKLFKEMITTKGKNGTGLGMYMSYSNIRAYFNGNITYDSVTGEGTTFNIILPINN